MEKGSRFGCLLKGEGIFVFMGVTKNYKQNNVLGRVCLHFLLYPNASISVHKLNEILK